jgi:tRNA wybutosine-synthesizing protein 3
MTFDNDKKMALQKPDKSKKGDVDEAIRKLCDVINKTPNYYTTSSCAGRIVLFMQPASGKKQDSEWILASHEAVSAEKVIGALNKYLEKCGKERVWLKEEGLILHVNCRTLDHATKFLQVVRDFGLKRSGIISIGKKIIIEMLDSEKVEALVTKDGELIVDERYIALLVDEANKKLLDTHKKIDALEKIISTL